MKCYLINLDRAPERLARMTELLNHHQVEFERIPAVDARKFTAEELSSYRSQRTVDHNLAPGDIACGATHIEILRHIVESGDSYSVVMEDDIHFSSDIRSFLTTCDWIPEGTDIVKLETFREKTIIDAKGIQLGNKRSIHRLRKAHGGTALYVISRNAAIKILNSFVPGVECIDVYLFSDKIDEFKVYQVSPAPAVQDNIGGFYSTAYLASDITEQRRFAKQTKPKGFAKLKREIVRARIKIYDFILYFWQRIVHGKKYGKIKYR